MINCRLIKIITRAARARAEVVAVPMLIIGRARQELVLEPPPPRAAHRELRGRELALLDLLPPGLPLRGAAEALRVKGSLFNLGCPEKIYFLIWRGEPIKVLPPVPFGLSFKFCENIIFLSMVVDHGLSDE